MLRNAPPTKLEGLTCCRHGVWGNAPKMGQGASPLWGLGQRPKVFFF